MRQGPNGRRPRGRHHSNGSGGGGGNGNGGSNGGGGGGGSSGGNRPRSAASLRHQSFDSNCCDLRVRGNAWQVYEKYQALARDATSAGDRVTAENFLQHAEHYFRIIEAINEATAQEQSQQQRVAAPYGGQPDVPNNYYVPAGAPGAPAGQVDGNVATAPQAEQPSPAQAEATVQSRTQPSSPFFTQEEIDEHNNGQPSVASR